MSEGENAFATVAGLALVSVSRTGVSVSRGGIEVSRAVGGAELVSGFETEFAMELESELASAPENEFVFGFETESVTELVTEFTSTLERCSRVVRGRASATGTGGVVNGRELGGGGRVVLRSAPAGVEGFPRDGGLGKKRWDGLVALGGSDPCGGSGRVEI